MTENNSVNQETTTATAAAARSIDQPPPAYEAVPTTTDNQENVVEAPPPYCLVDPSKIIHTDRLPHYAQITPVEIVDLNVQNNNHNNQPTESAARSTATRPAIAGWLVSGSNMDIGTDCTFLMAFIVAFFFNWLGFLAVICLIPTIAARFGAMSGFGLSVAKWITVMRYQEYNNVSVFNNTHPSHLTTFHDPAQNFVFAIVLFAGIFLFIRGLVSYITVKTRANQHGQTVDVFTWY